ncbi:MAG: IS1380 family transposase [Candidatus Stygibacter australis]|nr:IS1380 family transposase [Candidatus Stygibacter australis]
MKVKMQSFGQGKSRSNVTINSIESTSEYMSGRAGLPLVLKYIDNTDILSRLGYRFQYLKESTKGLDVTSFFRQTIAYMIEGSKLNLVAFNELKQDPSYAALLETNQEDLASTDQIKRMFNKFCNEPRHTDIFRDALSDTFISHLCDEQPPVVILGVDTMVMNNDQAKMREGCSPTYKKVKGFQPLEFYWNGMIIDAVFREGKCHSNHGDDVKTATKRLVKKIRKGYNNTVPIIIKMDSGFMSEDNFRYFEEKLGIFFICAGKMYKSIKNYIGELPVNERREFVGSHIWDYIEFGSKLKTWKKFRRTIYLQNKNANLQYILDFARSDSIIYTNIGMDSELSANLYAAIDQDIYDPEYIIKEYHKRGNDELCNRAFKDFATRENLPFQGFDQNQAFYYLLVLSHVLLQSYVKDICYDIIDRNSYPTTIRRRLIDFAGKFVYHARKIILKVSDPIFNRLKLNLLWERCNSHQRQLSYI